MESRSIFGSGAERATFHALRSQWQEQLDIFPQLPVKTVVGFNRIQAIQDEDQRSYLLQTEFDYVICRKRNGIPVLVIELDGIGGGFSRVLQYETHTLPVRHQNRRKKLEAKLRICAEAEIPAVVVSFQETTPIDAAGHLTILDAIIAEVWAADIF